MITIPQEKLTYFLNNLSDRISDVNRPYFEECFFSEYNNLLFITACEKGDLQTVKKMAFQNKVEYNESFAQACIQNNQFQCYTFLKKVQLSIAQDPDLPDISENEICMLIQYDKLDWYIHLTKTLNLSPYGSKPSHYCISEAIKHKNMPFVEQLMEDKFPLYLDHIFAAICTGDVNWYNKILALDPKLFRITPELFERAVTCAASSGSITMCEMMWNLFPNLQANLPREQRDRPANRKRYYGDLCQVLLFAIRSNSVDTVKFFLQRGWRVTQDHFTCAIDANGEIIEELLKVNPNLSQEVLETIINDGHPINILKAFLKGNCEFNEVLVQMAIENNNREQVQALWDYMIAIKFADCEKEDILNNTVHELGEEYDFICIEMLRWCESLGMKFDESASHLLNKIWCNYLDDSDHCREEKHRVVSYCIEKMSMEELVEEYNLLNDVNFDFVREAIAEDLNYLSLAARDKMFQMLEMEACEAEEDDPLRLSVKKIKEIQEKTLEYLYSEPTRPKMSKEVIEGVMCKYI